MFDAKSDLEAAAKRERKGKSKLIKKAQEALEMEMGLPLCRTEYETIAPPSIVDSHEAVSYTHLTLPTKA